MDGRHQRFGSLFCCIASPVPVDYKAGGASANGVYLANTLTESGATTGTYVYAPNYRTARSLQMNIGVQREMWKGGILSVDYLRNVGTHFMQSVDENHVGDARFVNMARSQQCDRRYVAGIRRYVASTMPLLPGAHHRRLCQATDWIPATIISADFRPAAFGLTPDQGAAFPGKNPGFGQMAVVYPMGRSVYNGLQMSLRQQTRIPLQAIKGSNLEVSYTFSRFLSSAGGTQAASADQNFTPGSWDNNNPLKYMGPGGLDRRQQLSFGGNITWAHNIETNFIGHLYTPLSTTLYLDSGGNTTGEIFQSDVTGDGSEQDIVPGLKPGAFMRSVTPHNIGNVIANYNSTYAGKITPAGQALITNNLFTSDQLVALGAVTRTIAAPIPGQVGNGTLRTFDFVLGRPVKIAKFGESFSLDSDHLLLQPLQLLQLWRNYGELELRSAVRLGKRHRRLV